MCTGLIAIILFQLENEISNIDGKAFEHGSRIPLFLHACTRIKSNCDECIKILTIIMI